MTTDRVGCIKWKYIPIGYVLPTGKKIDEHHTQDEDGNYTRYPDDWMVDAAYSTIDEILGSDEWRKL